MYKDRYIDNIEDYLILRKEECTLDQISACRTLKERIFSEEPYGIGDRDLYDIEQVSLQDTLESLERSDFDHVIFFDLVFFYRTGCIEDCTDRKEYVICGLFDMFITLMRVRLHDVLGIPEIIYTISSRKDNFIISQWEEVSNMSEDFKSIVESVEVPRVTSENLQTFVEKAKEDNLFDLVQKIEYYSDRSDVVCFEDKLVVHGLSHDLRVVLNRGYSGFMNLLPWLVFDRMSVSELSYYSGVCKATYEMFHSKRVNVEVRDINFLKKTPANHRRGGFIYCSCHKQLFCIRRHNKGFNLYDVINAIYDKADFFVLREIYYSMNYKYRNWLFYLVSIRDEFQSVSIVLSYLYSVAPSSRQHVVRALIGKYKKYFHFGMLLMLQASTGLRCLYMIDTSKMTIGCYLRNRGRDPDVLISRRSCGNVSIPSVRIGLKRSVVNSGVKYPLFVKVKSRNLYRKIEWNYRHDM